MNFLDERLPERFWDKVTPEPNSGCWLWTAAVRNGYGSYRSGRKNLYAHRVAHAIAYGDAPLLDHLCRVRSCCNPAHLEAVTSRENTLRSPIAPAALNAAKTHCPRGHVLSGHNLINHKHHKPKRECRKCHNAISNKARAKRPVAS